MRVDVPYFLWYGTWPSYKDIKILGVTVYIINGYVTRKNIKNISNGGYFMGYAATKIVFIYWNPYQPFVIHISQNVLFYGYNYSLSIEDKHTPGSLILQQDPESLLNNSDLLKLATCKLDIESIPFINTTILTYEIDSPPSVKIISFNLMNDEYFTIPHVTYTIPNSPSGHQLQTQVKQNVWIVDINIEEPITAQGSLDELNHHQNTCGK